MILGIKVRVVVHLFLHKKIVGTIGTVKVSGNLIDCYLKKFEEFILISVFDFRFIGRYLYRFIDNNQYKFMSPVQNMCSQCMQNETNSHAALNTNRTLRVLINGLCQCEV